MVARDWSKAFRQASFRGVPFWVDTEGNDGGRRLSVTQIAYGETPIIEDMGGAEDVWPTVAYVAGGVADAEALALTAACGAPGASTLVLPMLPATLARAWRCRRERRLDRNGYIAFDILFIEAGLDSIPFAPVLTAGPLAALMDAGKAILGQAFADLEL